MPIPSLRSQRRAEAALWEVFDHPETTLVIHYSCESFYDRPNGSSPRITSIAVRNLQSGQTRSFSIHQIAEREGLGLREIENQYNKLEKEMLDEFFEYSKQHQGHRWLHWNMRDINFGFAALEHRFRVLGGEPYAVLDEKKIDLARLLVSLYGTKYIGHPRLQKLMEKNHIKPLDFLDGRGEADAFEAGEYVKLHQSTLRKIDVLSNIAERAHNKSLKTDASFWEIHGGRLRAMAEFVKSHWLVSLIGLIAAITSIVATVLAAI